MILVRPFADADRAAVNAVARAAFAQYAQDDEDWPGFIEGIGRMADPAPVRGVPYGRCVLAAAAIPGAIGQPG